MKLHPVGDPFRLSVEYVDAGYVDGIPLVRPIGVSTQALPVEREGIYYVVSTLVQNAYPDRNDLLIPAMLVRDAAGNITGCTKLALRASVHEVGAASVGNLMQTFQRRYKVKRSLRLCKALQVVEQTLVPNDLDSRGYSTKFDGASRVINPGDWIILEGKRIYGCERELFDNLWIVLDVPRRG